MASPPSRKFLPPVLGKLSSLLQMPAHCGQVRTQPYQAGVQSDARRWLRSSKVSLQTIAGGSVADMGAPQGQASLEDLEALGTSEPLGGSSSS